MKTLLLDRSTWDLVLDVHGNIAVAADPYSQAQDAASEIRTFEGEVYYDTADGIPYWSQILGHWPPPSLMKAKFAGAALLTPGVVRATVFLAALSDRQATGQVQIVNSQGQKSAASF